MTENFDFKTLWQEAFCRTQQTGARRNWPRVACRPAGTRRHSFSSRTPRSFKNNFRFSYDLDPNEEGKPLEQRSVIVETNLPSRSSVQNLVNLRLSEDFVFSCDAGGIFCYSSAKQCLRDLLKIAIEAKVLDKSPDACAAPSAPAARRRSGTDGFPRRC